MTTAAQSPKAANIRQVATAAGVSHMTVSRVINDHPSIAPATRERVLEVMRQLNYRPNSAARALASRTTRRIGVIVDNVVEFGPGSTLRAIEDAAHERGYTVSSVAVDRAVTPHDAVESLLAIGIDALCLISPRSDSIDLLREGASGLPVLVVKPEPEEDLFTVSVDQHKGASLAMEHLLDLGHREIAHLAGPLDWLDARAREQAWREHLELAGAQPRPVTVGDWTSDSGYEFGRALAAELSEPSTAPRVTAVFAANDQMALGLIHALTKAGIRVPEHVSVVGFDDVPDARHFMPPLTTVRQDFRALGQLSIDTLIAALEGADVPQRSHIAPELVVRGSTAPPRSSTERRLA